MLRFLTGSALLLALVTAPALAQREATLDGSYFALKVTLGWAGEADGGRLRGAEIEQSSAERVALLQAPLNVRDPFGWDGGGTRLELTYGMAAQYMWPLQRYFALGGQLGVFAWRTEMRGFGDVSRNLGFDLAVVPQGRLPVLRWFELYLALPLGVTLDVFNQGDRESNRGTRVAFEGSTALGFTGSVLLGARFAISNRIGLFAELGYNRRWITETMKVSVAGRTVDRLESDLASWQLLSNVGVFY